MASYEFLVTVDITDNDSPEAWEERTPAKYALAALYSVSLRDARYLDGFVDLTSEAYITDIIPM